MTKTLNFCEALTLISGTPGSKMTRPEWDEHDYGLIQNDRLQIHLKDKFHDWIISYADLLADDWVVL